VPAAAARKEKKMNIPKICPRCNDNFIPNNLQPAAYPGAISRADDKTEICSDCGTEEALTQYGTGACEPVSDWPVRNRVI
jgi:hypothetical protein